MPTGTVVFFDDDGGYGFIDTEDREDDVFFHMSDVDGPGRCRMEWDGWSPDSGRMEGNRQRFTGHVHPSGYGQCRRR